MIYNWAGGQQQYYGADVIIWDSPIFIIGELLSALLLSFIDGYDTADPILRQYGNIRSQQRPDILDYNVSPSIVRRDGGKLRPKIKK